MPRRSLTTSKHEFETDTGWALNPEAACPSDIRIPLCEAVGDTIDQNGVIVRPAEPAPSPGREHPDADHAALLDWVRNGADSAFALDPDAVVERSHPREIDAARGIDHFELATHLESTGYHDAAIQHFRQAHRLVPDNFSHKRRAWSVEPGTDGASDRFWQGPSDVDPAAWPYDGDRSTDVRSFVAENNYPEFRP